MQREIDRLRVNIVDISGQIGLLIDDSDEDDDHLKIFISPRGARRGGERDKIRTKRSDCDGGANGLGLCQ